VIGRLLVGLASLVLVEPSFADAYPPAPPVGALKPFTIPPGQTFALPNGLKVTLIPLGSVPQAAISLKVYAGRINDNGKPWLAELTADMLKEGAGTRTSAEIADFAAAMGGNITVNVDSETTSLDLSVLSGHAPDAIALLADLVQRPSLPAGEFERVKANRARALAVALSQAQSIADQALARAYYGADHPYGSAYPEPRRFGAYSLEEVRAFYAGNFGAQRAVLYVAGRFDAAAVRAAVTKAFSAWGKGPQRLSLPPRPQRGPQYILVDRPGAPQSTIRLSFPGPLVGSAEDFPFKVMDTLLSGSFNSRITRNIRENKGYTYSPYSEVNYYPANTQWVFNADVTTASTGASLHEIFGEIRGLQSSPPGADETAGMRTNRATRPIFAGATAGGLISLLSYYEALGQPPSYIANYAQRALAVTGPQVTAAARATLPLDQMTLVVVGDLNTVVPQLKAQPELSAVTFKTVAVP
jgi:zinc protease